MKKPKVLILRTAGTNCDVETATAFKMAGAAPDLVHVGSLLLLRLWYWGPSCDHLFRGRQFRPRVFSLRCCGLPSYVTG